MNAAAQTTRLEVAETILAQLGGRQFIAMTGACNIGGDARGLQLRFKGSKVANHLRVTLERNDTYTVTFSKIRGLDCREVASREMVYSDSLRTVFTAITGLYTSF